MTRWPFPPILRHVVETLPALGIWSYAEANATALGVIVGCVMVAAAMFVARRVIEQIRARRRR